MRVRRGSQVPRILWLGGALPSAPAHLMLAAVSGILAAVAPCADAETSSSHSAYLSSANSPSGGFARQPICGELPRGVRRSLPAAVERWAGKSDLLWAVPSLGRPDPVTGARRIRSGGRESVRLASLAVYAAMPRAPPPRSIHPR